MRVSSALLVAACLVCAPAAASAQTIVREPAKPDFDTSGSANFKRYCSPCHGVSGKGDGPAARALKTPPADLTGITRRYGTFPEDKIRAMILGEEALPSHGDREMPVWGPAFHQMSGNDDTLYTKRLANLLNYLRSIQAK